MTSRGSDDSSAPSRTALRLASSILPAPPVVAALLGAALALAAAPSPAQSWRIEPALSAQETLTDNVNLAPNDSRRSDWVTELTPSLHLSEKGARTSLNGFISVPVLLYARTGSENNNVYPSVDLLGDIGLIEHWLHVEGQVLVSQQYFNPFGAQPIGFSSATQNRYQSATYRISPYIKGITPGNVIYELRNNNVWNNLSGAPISTNNSRYTQFTGKAENTQATIGWHADFDVNDVVFNNADSFHMRLVRLMPLYDVDPEIRLSATGGYEQNRFPLDNSENPIYGAGFEWHPTPRTDVVGSWEHRFFGGAYKFSFDHRMPLTVWKVRVSRDITTFPQQVASLPAGGDVASLLNSLFLTVIPDPAQRQQTVDQFISDRGLPSVLPNGLNLYAQEILLEESQSASVGLTGTRNTILLTIYNVRTEPISASGNPLTPLLLTGNNNRQTGVSLLWSHKFTPSLVFDATFDRFRTVANPPLEGTTNQSALRLVLSTPLSAKTTMFGGARYQTLRSDVTSDYNEAAVFVGITHTFR